MNEAFRNEEIVATWPLLALHQPELIAAHLLGCRPLTCGGTCFSAPGNGGFTAHSPWRLSRVPEIGSSSRLAVPPGCPLCSRLAFRASWDARRGGMGHREGIGNAVQEEGREHLGPPASLRADRARGSRRVAGIVAALAPSRRAARLTII